MSDVGVRVSAILGEMVDISVMEVGKMVGVSDSREESECGAEAAQKSSSETVGNQCFCFFCFLFMESMVRVGVPTSRAWTAEHRNRRASEPRLVFTPQLVKTRPFKRWVRPLQTRNSSRLSLVWSRLRSRGERSATGRHFELKSGHLLFYLLYVYRLYLQPVTPPVSAVIGAQIHSSHSYSPTDL